MANISDAFGTVKVDKVGKEFIEYCKIAGDNYYTLLGYRQDIPEPKEDIEFEFSTYGRWNFRANLEGYLDPEGHWHNEEAESEAYKKLCEAIFATDGSIRIEYTDSDEAMGWAGSGVAELSQIDGQLQFTSNFYDDK